jgi:ABC-type glycerol-3-phosphate transport system substrate-binding protein
VDAGIQPIAMGAKDNWRAGHLHNALFYRSVGVAKAEQLGNREASWTDADVVASFQLIDDLNKMGAFGENAEGVDYEQEKVAFLTGKAAMDFNAAYFISEIEASEVADDISVFAVPSFPEHPELAGDFRQTLNAYLVSNKLDEAQQAALAKFAAYVTGADAGKKYATEAKSMVPRTDVDVTEEEVGRLYMELSAIGELVTNPAPDIFIYDPLPSMQDVTRNATVGILTGLSAADAAKQIQDEIDSNS